MGDGVVLCVDDDAILLQALRTLLSRELGAEQWVEIAEGGEEALEVCRDLRQQGRHLAVVISDYIMPGMRGDEFLVRLHKDSPRTIKILLTGQSDIRGVKRAINEAALYRFLEKPIDSDDLVLTTQSALRAFRQESELQRQHEALLRLNQQLETQVGERTRELQLKNEALERLAITDQLTGLYNRRRLDQILDQAVSRSRRYEDPLSLLLLDIDHFKQVNDEHGHQAGDRVLVEVAEVLRRFSREADELGRWGGEEFLFVCANTGIDGALALAEKLRERVAAHDFSGLGPRSLSIGVSTYRVGDTAASLLGRADKALYQAKALGRNRVELET